MIHGRIRKEQSAYRVRKMAWSQQYQSNDCRGVEQRGVQHEDSVDHIRRRATTQSTHRSDQQCCSWTLWCLLKVR